ncbi:MAG TPA: GreA/GreB family elongation factor [Clostridiales bacterium]|nr:GreA/GreB family elongation factor [Clostridiales bacterium]
MYYNISNDRMLESLNSHVKKVREGKEMLINEYYREETEESIKLSIFLKEYVSSLNNYINSTKSNNESGMIQPVVTIGSIVTVKDLDDNKIYRYQIVLPFLTNLNSDHDDASCLSPLGKALLLKTIDEKVEIEIPAGTLRYVVKSITPPESFIPAYNK